MLNFFAKGSNTVFPIMLLEIRFNPTGLCGWLLVWSVPLYNGDVYVLVFASLLLVTSSPPKIFERIS